MTHTPKLLFSFDVLENADEDGHVSYISLTKGTGGGGTQKSLVNVLPVLFEIILSFERFTANFARERYVILVRPLVYHKIIRFGESSLTIFADEFAFRPHFAPELPPLIGLHLHNREHLDCVIRTRLGDGSGRFARSLGSPITNWRFRFRPLAGSRLTPSGGGSMQTPDSAVEARIYT